MSFLSGFLQAAVLHLQVGVFPLLFCKCFCAPFASRLTAGNADDIMLFVDPGALQARSGTF